MEEKALPTSIASAGVDNRKNKKSFLERQIRENSSNRTISERRFDLCNFAGTFHNLCMGHYLFYHYQAEGLQGNLL